MNETMNWQDLKLFLAVSRSGGLAGARALTGCSVPTLGRRMQALEESLGLSLFLRHRQGYDLTDQGRELLALAVRMEENALSIDRWREQSRPRPLVTIAAGNWTALFLARHLRELSEGSDGATIEILSGIASADLARREANIGIRSRRPQQTGLACHRMNKVSFFLFSADPAKKLDQAPDTLSPHAPWLRYQPPGPVPPSTQWISGYMQTPPAYTFSSASALIEAARSGAGICVLPNFIAGSDPGLEKVSDEITSLTHDQWLVLHDDDRHQAQIRQMADRINRLFRLYQHDFS